MIGASAGHLTIMGINSIKSQGIQSILQGKYIYLLSIVLGLLLFARFFTEWAWLIRYGMAFIIGSLTSVMIFGTITVNVVDQINKAMTSLYLINTPFDMFNNIIMFSMTVSVIYYFIYTNNLIPANAGTKSILTYARYSIMIQIGYYLGNTIMTRLSFVIDRLQYLLFTWLGL